MVLLGRGDLHLGRRPDDAGGHHGRPGGVRGHHQVLLGHLDQPGVTHRRPQRAKAVQIGGGRGLSQHRQPPVDGVGDNIRRHPPRRSDQHEVGAHLAQARVQGREDRHIQGTRGPHHRPSAADRAQLTRHLEEHPRPPAAADQRERGHAETVTRSRRAAPHPTGMLANAVLRGTLRPRQNRPLIL